MLYPTHPSFVLWVTTTSIASEEIEIAARCGVNLIAAVNKKTPSPWRFRIVEKPAA
jgi:hypothetical protein